MMMESTFCLTMTYTLVKITTTQRRFAPTVSIIVGIAVHQHRNSHGAIIDAKILLLMERIARFQVQIVDGRKGA